MTELRTDSLVNALSGLGSKVDKTKRTQIDTPCILAEETLNQIWVGDGLGNKIVKTIPDDMMRAGFTIPDDPQGEIAALFKARGFYKDVLLALYWQRLQGGCLIVKHYDSREGNLDQPLSQTPGNLVKLSVYSRDRIQNTTTDIISDPKSPYFDDYETFKIQKNYTGDTFSVHASRCIVLKGIPCPMDSYFEHKYKYWGFSVIQVIWDELTHLGAGFQGIAHLLQEVSIGKYTIEGLSKILADKDGIQKLYQRLEAINASKSIVNGVLLSEKEAYERDSITFSGVPDVLDRLMMLVSAVTEIPVTRLFGRSPAGQNSTGESDLQNYYDKVEGLQKYDLDAVLLNICTDLNRETNTVKESTLTIQFNPVWTPSQKELITMRKEQSETDKTYIDLGVLDSQEVRESRFGIDGYSFETEVDPDTLPEKEPKSESTE